MPTSRHGRLVSILFILAAGPLLGVAPAHAQTMKKAAKTFFDRGATEYNLGHFAEAIGQFEKAYELDPAPILLFNIGQCHRQSGNKERAVFFYRRYLEQSPTATNRAEVESRIADLDRSLKEEKELQQRPPTSLQPPSAAEPGTPPQTASTPEPAQPGAPAPVAAAAAAAPVAETVSRAATGPAPESDNGHTLRVAAWTTGGVAAAGLLLGLVETIVWRSKLSDFDNHLGPSAASATQTTENCGADDPNRGGPGCSDLYDGMKHAETVAIIGTVVGVLAAGASATLFVTDARAEHKPGLAFRCGPGPEGIGVLCGGSF